MSVYRKDGGVEAPVSLGGLFPDEEDDGILNDEFDQNYEEQELQLSGKQLIIQQYAWHKANANKVWPGTFVLASYLEENIDNYRDGKLPKI